MPPLIVATFSSARTAALCDTPTASMVAPSLLESPAQVSHAESGISQTVSQLADGSEVRSWLAALHSNSNRIWMTSEQKLLKCAPGHWGSRWSSRRALRQLPPQQTPPAAAAPPAVYLMQYQADSARNITQ